MPLPVIEEGICASVEQSIKELQESRPDYIDALFADILTSNPRLGGFILGSCASIENQAGSDVAKQARKLAIWIVLLLKSQAEADDMKNQIKL